MLLLIFSSIILINLPQSQVLSAVKLPLVINTWPFTNATEGAWNALKNENASAIEALVRTIFIPILVLRTIKPPF